MKVQTLETGNNILASINIKDESFDRVAYSDCDLAVYFDTCHFSYSLLDKIHNKVISLYSMDQPEDQTSYQWLLNEAFPFMKKDLPHKMPFDKIKIAIDLGENALVPNKLFIPEKMTTYLDFTTLSTGRGKPFSDYLSVISTHNIYAVPEQIFLALKSLFKRQKLMHGTTPFVYNIVKENRGMRADALFVNFARSKISVLGLRRGQLVFFNRFPANTKTDLSYFLLAVCEELKFNPEQVDIVFYGDIDEEDPHYLGAKRYLNNISFGDRPKIYKYSRDLELLPPQSFYHLFSINTCE